MLEFATISIAVYIVKNKTFRGVLCSLHACHANIAVLADLGTLLRSLESIRASWYNFGLQLRVYVGILDGIAYQYSNP